jgi:hypothetical protein
MRSVITRTLRQIKEDEMDMVCSMHGENAYRILVGKPEGKRSLGRPKRRLKDNIIVDLTKVGWVGMDRIHLAQDMKRWRTLVNTEMNLRVP